MISTELYDGTAPHERGSRTSLGAALDIESARETLRALVLKLIASKGAHGQTDDEIERALDMRHQTASARRRELVLLGLVQDSGTTRKTRSGRSASVWVALKPGDQLRLAL